MGWRDICTGIFGWPKHVMAAAWTMPFPQDTETVLSVMDLGRVTVEGTRLMHKDVCMGMTPDQWGALLDPPPMTMEEAIAHVAALYAKTTAILEDKAIAGPVLEHAPKLPAWVKQWYGRNREIEEYRDFVNRQMETALAEKRPVAFFQTGVMGGQMNDKLEPPHSGLVLLMLAHPSWMALVKEYGEQGFLPTVVQLPGNRDFWQVDLMRAEA